MERVELRRPAGSIQDRGARSRGDVIERQRTAGVQGFPELHQGLLHVPQRSGIHLAFRCVVSPGLGSCIVGCSVGLTDDGAEFAEQRKND
eukprot:UN09028